MRAWQARDSIKLLELEDGSTIEDPEEILLKATRDYQALLKNDLVVEQNLIERHEVLSLITKVTAA